MSTNSQQFEGKTILLSTLMMIMVKIGHDMSLGLGKDWKCEFVVGNVVHL